MARHEVALRGHEEIAEGTMAFRFDKPAGFSFKAGQSVSIALLDPPAEPNSARRTFSLASAPFEDELMVATRMREGSAFKRALQGLPDGAQVRLTGPLGAMTLHEDSARAAVLIAGGIGITPFRSLLLQAEHERLAHPLLLAYSNRQRGHAAFIEELEALQRRQARFRLLARMTDAEGFLDEEALRHFTREAPAPVYYLAGPPAMVQAMKAILARIGAGAADVRSEEFYGY
jgi:ferredoxin-NADP reductase